MQTYLFVLPWALSFRGGVNQVVKCLCAEMRKDGRYEPVVLINDWSAARPKWSSCDGIRTVHWRVRSIGSAPGLKERIVFRLWLASFRRAFRSFCDRHDVAVINLHYPGPAAFAFDHVLAGRCTPIVYSFHGGDLYTIQKEGNLQQWSALLRRGTAVVACAKRLASEVQSTFSVAVLPIYNGVDASAFVASAFSSERGGSRRRVLSVGTFEYGKGHDVVIKAFASIANAYPDVDLVVVGGSGAELAALRQLAVDTGVNDRTTFIVNASHQEVAAHYSTASVFTLMSRTESLGLAILEAGAFGLPVVVSDVGGIPEIITDASVGILVQPEDCPALADSLSMLLSDRETAERMGARLKVRVESRFSWKDAWSQYRRIADTAPVHPERAATSPSSG